MVDNLVTYIKNKNFKDFTMENEFNSMKYLILRILLWKILIYVCVCVCVD